MKNINDFINIHDLLFHSIIFIFIFYYIFFLIIKIITYLHFNHLSNYYYFSILLKLFLELNNMQAGCA